MCASGPEICRYIHLKVRASYVLLYFSSKTKMSETVYSWSYLGPGSIAPIAHAQALSTWQANAKKPKQTNKKTKVLRSNKGIHPYVPFTWVRGWPWVSPFSSHWSLWMLKCCFSGTEKCKLYNVYHYTFVAQIWQIYSKTDIVLNLFNANSIQQLSL